MDNKPSSSPFIHQQTHHHTPRAFPPLLGPSFHHQLLHSQTFFPSPTNPTPSHLWSKKKFVPIEKRVPVSIKNGRKSSRLNYWGVGLGGLGGLRGDGKITSPFFGWGERDDGETRVGAMSLLCCFVWDDLFGMICLG